MVLFGVKLAERGFLKIHSLRLQHDIRASFRQRFPDAKKGEDPRDQIEQELAQLRKLTQRIHYIYLISRMGTILNRYPKINLESIAHKNN